MTPKTLLAAAAVAALALPTPARAAAPAPGKERTESLIAAFKKVKPDDGKLTAAEKAANARHFAELDGYLDFETLVSKPIAPRAAKLTPAQLADYKAKFRELIRLIAYPNSGEFFRDAKWKIGPEKVQGELLTVPVDVRVPAEDLETVVEFQWAKVDGTLQIQDVLFEGDSLVKDYQNQVSRVVDKQGAAGLIKALDDRLAELNKGKK